MLETVYIGLSQLPKLTSLSVRFPSSRHPRPTIVIPPMPHLRSLKVTDIDPLCYPDDISTLLARSRNLRELKMHWSPRMREAQEPSVILHDYFRKCVRERPLKLKSISMQNLYARNTEDWSEAIDESSIEEVTFLSSPGFEDAASSTFLHNTWTSRPPKGAVHFKSMRHDSLNKKLCEFLSTFTGLERLYFVNPIRSPYDQLNSPRPSAGPSSTTVTPPRIESTSTSTIAPPTTTAASAIAARAVSPASPHSPSNNSQNNNNLLRDSYFSTIVGNHGATLRHLLLPARWPLSANQIARLVHACPNLEQLALAAEITALDAARLLLPFLRKLVAIRFLIPQTTTTEKTVPPGQPTSLQVNDSSNNTFSTATLTDIVELDDWIHTEKLGAVLADKETFGRLKVVGLGWKGWELGEFYTIPAETVDQGHAVANGNSSNSSSNNNNLPTGEPQQSQGHAKEPTTSTTTTTTTTFPTKSCLGKHPRGEEPEPSSSSSPPSPPQPQPRPSPSTPIPTEVQQNNNHNTRLTPTNPNPVQLTNQDNITQVLPSGERVI